MKNSLVTLSAIGLLLTGCSAAYKSGQTPDDVYYSSNPKAAAVAVRHEEPNNEAYNSTDEGYQSYFSSEEDNYLKMKVANGGRWNSIDDYDYWYGYNTYSPYMRGMGPYSFNSLYYNYNMLSPYQSIGYSYALTNYYNPYGFMNYSGYGYGYGHSAYYPVIINKRPTYSVNGYRPSLSAYGNNQYDRGRTNRTPTRRSDTNYNSYFNNNRSNNSTNNSNSSQRYFNNSSNSSTPSYSAPASSGSSRTSGGSSSSGSSSSGRGGRGGL